MTTIGLKQKSVGHIRLVDTMTGRLIYEGIDEESIPKIYKQYHEWRTEWCNKRIMVNGQYIYPTRKLITPPGFREGKVTLLNLGFYFINKLFGG
jgi:hypothetical protein